MVFSANSGTVIDGRVLGSRFRAPQRAAEAEHFRRWFVEHGYRDLIMPTKINEAEGDFAWTGRLLLAGTGFRTDPEAHGEAQEALGVPVVSLRLIDPKFYHLDTALFVLAEATDSTPAQIAYYPAAFSAGSLRVLGGCSRTPSRPPPPTPNASASTRSPTAGTWCCRWRPPHWPPASRARLRTGVRGHLGAAQGRRRPQVLHHGNPQIAPPGRECLRSF